MGVVKQVRQRLFHSRVREIAQRAGHLPEVPFAGDIGERHDQRHGLAGLAQYPHHGLAVGGRCGFLVQLRHDGLGGFRRPALQQVAKDSRLCQNTLREEGAVREHHFQQAPAGLIFAGCAERLGEVAIL